MFISAVLGRRRSECGHACAIRSAGEERASAPIRALLAAFVAFVCATSIVTYASAEESGGDGGGHSFGGPNVGIIFYGPKAALDSNANQVNEVGVTAYNEYDAAAYVLGYSYGEVRSWSSDIHAKLSNSETGGSFWQLAKTFTHTNNIDGVQWFTANVLYGEDLCWRSLYSDELYRNALSDCQTIINGGDVGGGGGSGDSTIPDTLVFKMENSVSAPSYAFWGYSTDSYYSPLSVTLNLPIQYVKDDFSSYASDFQYKYYFLWRNEVMRPGSSMTLNVYFSDKPLVVQKGVSVAVTSGTRVISKQYDTSRLSVNGTNDLSLSYSGSRVNDRIWSSDYTLLDFKCYVFLIDNQSAAPVPPSNWPEEPTAPSPPELPEPGTNPTVEPEPWQPIIDLPDFSFDLNVTTEPNNDEVIDWLKKIYYELRNFHTDSRGWFAEISDGFDDVVQAVNSACSQLYSQLLVIDDHLRNEFHQTRTYLYNLFHWLAKQIDFQNDPYNDSNVVYWLKQIWSKLGGGINTRPTDPTTEPENWWDWLIKAIQNFLIGLAASANDLISEIADIASQVMHEFPFSIPWDIAAILAALTAAPITPAFTVTIPAIDGWWQQFDVVVDLKPFDTAAETIRLMEKLLFTGFLIWKSKDLLDFMDVTRWFD